MTETAKDVNDYESEVYSALEDLENIREDFERLEKIKDERSLVLASALRNYRKSIGMRLNTLADIMDTSQGFLHQIENGKRRISKTTSDKIISFLNSHNVKK